MSYGIFANPFYKANVSVSFAQDMIHIADTKVARRYGDFFIRQIHKFEEVSHNVHTTKNLNLNILSHVKKKQNKLSAALNHQPCNWFFIIRMPSCNWAIYATDPSTSCVYAYDCFTKIDHCVILMTNNIKFKIKKRNMSCRPLHHIIKSFCI